MTEEKVSFRRILAATSIVGGATALTILIGVLRTKLIALAVGPEGIGLMGVFTNIMGVAAAIGGMGLGFSGVRQIAVAEATRSLARRALWLATLPLASIAGLVLWLWRIEISRFVTGSTDHALGVGFTGVGVALSIAASAQVAVIQGHLRVGDLARVRIYGALLSLIIGVPAVLYGGAAGIVAAVIAVPLGSVLAALPYRPRAEPLGDTATAKALRDQWSHLFTLGAVVMVTSSLGSAALILIRANIIRTEGIQAAGLYQAAYSISAMNVALVLTAMATDFFPRLTGIEGDRVAANRLVNQQLRAALLLGAPILATMVAAAPLVLRLLYSDAFAPAAAMLRWQVTGELLKLPGWALGFLLIARKDKGTFLFVEFTFVALYLAGAYLLQSLFGLSGVGFAYLGAYLAYSVVLMGICRKRHSILLSRENLGYLGLVLAALIGVILLSSVSTIGAAIVGITVAVALGLYAVREFDRMTNLLARFRKSRGQDLGTPFVPLASTRFDGGDVL